MKLKYTKTILASCLAFSLFTPSVVYATENTQTEETQTQEASAEDSTEKASIEADDAPVVEEAPVSEESSDTVTLTQEEQENRTFGWLKINATVTNSTFDTETTIKMYFKNTKTNEVIEKELSSVDEFSSQLKMPYGEYEVSYDDDYISKFVLSDETVTINGDLQEYTVLIDGYVSEEKASQQVEDKKSTPTETFLSILKNNLIFIVILVICCGYLLYKAAKRRME